MVNDTVTIFLKYPYASLAILLIKTMFIDDGGAATVD